MSLAKAIGRPATMIFVRLIEPAALLALGLSPKNIYIASDTFIVFLGIPVGTKAIEKALLMDYTPKKSRGKWNALESINRVSWAGSSALGGLLMTFAGWAATFGVSGCVVGLSVFVMSGLLSMVAS